MEECIICPALGISAYMNGVNSEAVAAGRAPVEPRKAVTAERILSIINIVLTALLILAVLAYYEQWLYQQNYQALVKAWDQAQSNEKVVDNLINEINAPAGKEQLSLQRAQVEEIIYRYRSHLRTLQKVHTPPRHLRLRKLQREMVLYDQGMLYVLSLNKRLLTSKPAAAAKLTEDIEKANLKVVPLRHHIGSLFWQIFLEPYRPFDGFFNYLQIAAGIKF